MKAAFALIVLVGAINTISAQDPITAECSASMLSGTVTCAAAAIGGATGVCPAGCQDAIDTVYSDCGAWHAASIFWPSAMNCCTLSDKGLWTTLITDGQNIPNSDPSCGGAVVGWDTYKNCFRTGVQAIGCSGALETIASAILVAFAAVAAQLF